MEGKLMSKTSLLMTAVMALPLALSSAASAQTPAKKPPNIVMIMGDDVGMWNLSTYHQGMMGGSTPNIDRIARDGAKFTDYLASNPAPRGALPSFSVRPRSEPVL
jgi:hypothetical protein